MLQRTFASAQTNGSDSIEAPAVEPLVTKHSLSSGATGVQGVSGEDYVSYQGAKSTAMWGIPV